MHTTDITNREQLNTIMDPEGPTAMIDLWADWCGPCRAMAPHFEAVAEHLTDEPIEFYKLDTQTYAELAASFGVRSLPTVVLVHEGEILDVLIGSKSGQELAKKAEWLLSKARGEGFFDRLIGRKKSN
jgi:thioredoxin 1